MSRTNPAGLHLHSFWQERASDTTLPLWLRIAAHAYASHYKNGHAPCILGGASTLPDALGKSKRAIQNEIKTAINRGFLARESNANCLVLPDGIFGGAEGHKFADCKLHPAADPPGAGQRSTTANIELSHAANASSVSFQEEEIRKVS